MGLVAGAIVPVPEAWKMMAPRLAPRAAHDVGVGQGRATAAKTPRVSSSPPQRLRARRLALCRQSR
jgi:hypothetical protein